MIWSIWVQFPQIVPNTQIAEIYLKLPREIRREFLRDECDAWMLLNKLFNFWPCLSPSPGVLIEIVLLRCVCAMYSLYKCPGLNNLKFYLFVIFCCLWSIRGRHCFVFCGLLHCLLKVHPKTILKWSCNFVEWSGKSQGILFFIFCGNPEKSLGVNFLPVVSLCM